jgi:triphosphoribosyl-dephospho-CoA synthase
MSISREALQEAIRRACELDVRALKPGNVAIDAPGHGMNAVDFLRSAEAIVEPITASASGVGERIYRAVEATQRVVACNTNLGIALLLAPLIQASMLGSSDESLQGKTQRTLRELTVSDADWAYRAIRLANPGGMGSGVEHDIAEPPQVSLLQAMETAAVRDQIARLYATGFHSLFQRNVPIWRDALARHGEREWAATAVFLESLAREPDSLIGRKFGIATSEQISQTANSLWQRFSSSQHPPLLQADLIAWDVELKASGINPGTTADITVATAFLADLQEMR